MRQGVTRIGSGLSLVLVMALCPVDLAGRDLGDTREGLRKGRYVVGVAYASQREGSGYSSGGSKAQPTKKRTTPSRPATPTKWGVSVDKRVFGTPQAFAMRVVSPGTLELSDGKIVKLIGIAPHLGSSTIHRKAMTLLDRLCVAKTVNVHYEQIGKGGRREKKAYVYLIEGQMINTELIRRGYARVQRDPPFERLEEFLVYEQQAKAAGRGLWKE